VFTTNYFAKCKKAVAFAIVLLLDLSNEKYEKMRFASILFKIRKFTKGLHVILLIQSVKAAFHK
jgi:hypothetical protein